MTVPQLNTDQKSAAAAASAVLDNFDDSRSTIGLHSDYSSVVSTVA